MLGLFCLVVPRAWLTYENLPPRYKDLSYLGGILYYMGIVVVIIAICGLLQILFRHRRNNAHY